MGKSTPNQADFVASNENAKSQTVGQFVRIARKARLDYADFLYVCQQARKKLGLKTPKKERKLPQLLSEAALQRFFRVIQDCGDVQHEIMLKFLFYTAVRVSELVCRLTRTTATCSSRSETPASQRAASSSSCRATAGAPALPRRCTRISSATR